MADSTSIRVGGRPDCFHKGKRPRDRDPGQRCGLRALSGLADVVGDQGDCAVSISLDGKVVWNRDSVRGGEKPQTIDLDLTAAKQLELRVEYGARYDIADHFVLADAYVIKK